MDVANSQYSVVSTCCENVFLTISQSIVSLFHCHSFASLIVINAAVIEFVKGLSVGLLQYYTHVMHVKDVDDLVPVRNMPMHMPYARSSF